MYVEVGKEGRIILPKELRERREITEKTRLIIREREGEIILIPIKKYEKPTDALQGSLHTEEPIDEPKEYARKHVKEKLLQRFEP